MGTPLDSAPPRKKTCPSCNARCGADWLQCPECGYQFGSGKQSTPTVFSVKAKPWFIRALLALGTGIGYALARKFLP